MKRVWKLVLVCLGTVLLAVLLWGAWYWHLIPRRTYTAADFSIDTVLSTADFNGNGTDDYTDLLRGAKKDAKNHPRYDGTYYAGGYPPEEIGVCTDLVWRAFREAGYSLKEMVDRDIVARPSAYRHIKERDPNIDFRRVTNLRIFFEKYARSLTLEVESIEAWQPGDIVVFDDDAHIGIVSDKRNRDGQPYILHNGGQPVREEDILGRSKVSGHYRFDAAIISKDVLLPYEGEAT